jgi:oligopeptide transport system substrate-binding protein
MVKCINSESNILTLEGIKLLKRNLALLLIVMLVASMFIGCGSSSNTDTTAPADTSSSSDNTADTSSDNSADTASNVDQVLYWNIGAEPKTIDPGLNSATDGGNVINNMFEGLMREVNGKLTPAMAESYTVSDDGLVYTFKLRDDVRLLHD